MTRFRVGPGDLKPLRELYPRPERETLGQCECGSREWARTRSTGDYRIFECKRCRRERRRSR